VPSGKKQKLSKAIKSSLEYRLKLSKQLEISYPEDFNLSYNMVSYHDYSRQGEGPYALYVVYFNESEENIQNYLAGRFISPSRYTKVSNHLYVCLFERQMV